MSELLSIGQRLNYLKKLLNLNLSNFLKLVNISRSRFKSLEKKEQKITEEEARCIAEIISLFNIKVSFDWLIQGTGEKPQVIEDKNGNLLQHLKLTDLRVPTFLAYINPYEAFIYISAKFYKVLNIPHRQNKSLLLKEAFDKDAYSMISQKLKKAFNNKLDIFTYVTSNNTFLKLHFFPHYIIKNSNSSQIRGCYLFYIPINKNNKLGKIYEEKRDINQLFSVGKHSSKEIIYDYELHIKTIRLVYKVLEQKQIQCTLSTFNKIIDNLYILTKYQKITKSLVANLLDKAIQEGYLEQSSFNSEKQ